MRLRLHLALAGLAGVALVSVKGVAQTPTPSAPPRLWWPVACRVGVDCQIQHYIDHDPSPAVKDYACGIRTYDAHDGVDIRVPDMAAERRGVAVLAAADGKVLRIRDGVADVFMRASDLAAVSPIGCGNAVVIDHGGGFTTAYCHMAKGSVSVKPGQAVKAGEPIGRVGLSGETQFPHLHFSILENGKTIDPFAYGAAQAACNAGVSLWRQTPPYEARVILNTGFTGAVISNQDVEEGQVTAPGPQAAILGAYVRAIGLNAGDVQSLSIQGPDGATIYSKAEDALPKFQDERFLLGGKRRSAGQTWPHGRYVAVYTVTSGGREVLRRRFELTL
jgi:hypothetical protein